MSRANHRACTSTVRVREDSTPIVQKSACVAKIIIFSSFRAVFQQMYVQFDFLGVPHVKGNTSLSPSQRNWKHFDFGIAYIKTNSSAFLPPSQSQIHRSQFSPIVTQMRRWSQGCSHQTDKQVATSGISLSLRHHRY